MAAALVTGTVVPALALIRDAMTQSREMHKLKLLSNYAVQVLEQQAATIAINWPSPSTSTEEGDFASDGHSSIRFEATRSDTPGQGGIIDQLMSIEVLVFEDADNDSNRDADEIQVTYRTKVAKLISYENEEQ